MKISTSLSLKIILGIIVTTGLFSCQESSTQLDPKLFVDAESLSVPSFSKEYSVELLSNTPWEAETNVEWIDLAEKKGDKGKNKIIFTVLENKEDERKGKIRITTTETSQVIEIVQESGKSAEFYVKEGGTGEGTSWDDATNLVHALDSANSGNIIHIAAGTYNPTETITGGDPANDGDLTFEISKNLTLKGGYPANAAKGAVSDPQNYNTLLSGQLDNGNETYHVVTITAPKIEDGSVMLEGLTISGGNTSPSSTSVTINGTEFRRDYGGGVIVGNARVEIINSEIIDNNSRKFVAGLYIFGESYVTIRNSKINDNHSDSNVGGIWVSNSTAYIYNTKINGNTSGGTAPAVHGYPNATIYMYNSTIANNMGRSFGAAFYVRQNSKGILVNSLITGNESTSTHGGGGVMMYNNCEVDIVSTTITDNKIAGPGGGVYRRKGSNILNIYNSIISGNKQQDGSSDVDAYEDDASNPGITSSIIGSNTFDDVGNEITGAAFIADEMLDGSYIPTGEDNPAIEYGMGVNALQTLGDSYEPSLEEDLISSDMNGKSRSGLTTMGPLVE